MGHSLCRSGAARTTSRPATRSSWTRCSAQTAFRCRSAIRESLPPRAIAERNTATSSSSVTVGREPGKKLPCSMAGTYWEHDRESRGRYCRDPGEQRFPQGGRNGYHPRPATERWRAEIWGGGGAPAPTCRSKANGCQSADRAIERSAVARVVLLHPAGPNADFDETLGCTVGARFPGLASNNSIPASQAPSGSLYPRECLRPGAVQIAVRARVSTPASYRLPTGELRGVGRDRGCVGPRLSGYRAQNKKGTREGRINEAMASNAASAGQGSRRPRWPIAGRSWPIRTST